MEFFSRLRRLEHVWKFFIYLFFFPFQVAVATGSNEMKIFLWLK